MLAGVGARQCEKVFDDVFEAAGFGAQDFQRFAIFVGRAERLGERYLGFAAKNRDRRAKFVGSVGDESSLLIERLIETIEETVEAFGELAELVFGILDGETFVQVFGAD